MYRLGCNVRVRVKYGQDLPSQNDLTLEAQAPGLRRELGIHSLQRSYRFAKCLPTAQKSNILRRHQSSPFFRRSVFSSTAANPAQKHVRERWQWWVWMYRGRNGSCRGVAEQVPSITRQAYDPPDLHGRMRGTLIPVHFQKGMSYVPVLPSLRYLAGRVSSSRGCMHRAWKRIEADYVTVLLAVSVGRCHP